MNLSNFSQIRHNGKDIALAKLNGDILYKRETDVPVEPIEKEYAIEYTIEARNSSDTLTAKYTYNSTNYYYYLPRLSNGNSYSISSYKEILITKKDGTTTTSTSTYAKDVKSIKIWWDPDTIKQISFHGWAGSDSCRVKSILNIDKMNTSKLTSMSGMFNGCSKLTSLDLSNWDTSSVTNMSQMFSYCTSLTSLDLSNFNTSKVTNMEAMFYSCSQLTSLDVSSFNTSRVTNMYDMFASCKKLTSLDLSNFNTSRVTDMGFMFNFNDSLISLNLSNFDTSNVIDMSYMFSYCKSLTALNLSNWDMTKVTNYSSMFSSISNLKYIDLSESVDSTITKVVSSISSRTEAGYGEILVPKNTSQSVINSMINKYWKPVGPILVPASIEITSGLDEIIGIGKTTKLYHYNQEWYITDYSVEFITSDDSIAYINENNELVSLSYGNVEVYGRVKENNEIISNTININISETDSYPNVIKFIGNTSAPTNSNYIVVNGSNIKLANMNFNHVSRVYTYDVGSPITSIRFNGANTTSYSNIEELIKLNTSKLTTMYNMFNNCSSLTSLDMSNWDTSNVTNMSYMFYNCQSLTSLDVSNWDTGNVTSMSCMFQYCSKLTSLDLSSFDTSKVTSMGSMLANCYSLISLDLSNFDTSKVTNPNYISSMFSNTPLDIDFHYTGDNYQKFNRTEAECGYDGIFQWNLPSDITYSDDYYTEYSVVECSAPLDYMYLRKLGIPSISIAGRLTYKFQKVVITLKDGSTTQYTGTPTNLIKSVRVYYPSISDKILFRASFNPVKIDNNNYYNFFYNISYVNTSNVTDMNHMFYNCQSLTSLNLSNFDTSNVIDMSYMFDSCYSLNSLDLSNTFNTANVTNMGSMFQYCSLLTSLDVSNFDTSSVTDMSSMFGSCSKLTSLDLSSFDTSSVTDMSSIFYGCTSLTSLDLSNFNTSNVTNMSYMFGSCVASIYGGYNFAIKGSCNNMFEYFSGSIYDISSGSVYNASYMFAGSNIDDYTFANTFFYNVDFSNCSDMSYMFYNCTNLNYFYFNDSSYHKTYGLNDTSYMFAGCTNLSELYINYMYTSNVWSYDGMFNDVYGSIYIGSDFTLTESDTGYNGTFSWY